MNIWKSVYENAEHFHTWTRETSVPRKAFSGKLAAASDTT